MGADIPKSKLVGWFWGAMKALPPLIERIEDDVMKSDASRPPSVDCLYARGVLKRELLEHLRTKERYVDQSM